MIAKAWREREALRVLPVEHKVCKLCVWGETFQADEFSEPKRPGRTASIGNQRGEGEKGKEVGSDGLMVDPKIADCDLEEG